MLLPGLCCQSQPAVREIHNLQCALWLHSMGNRAMHGPERNPECGGNPNCLLSMHAVSKLGHAISITGVH